MFHEFANKFYGEEMGLHINRFLRAEGKYDSFGECVVCVVMGMCLQRS